MSRHNGILMYISIYIFQALLIYIYNHNMPVVRNGNKIFDFTWFIYFCTWVFGCRRNFTSSSTSLTDSDKYLMPYRPLHDLIK